jgi:hypothetical protein
MNVRLSSGACREVYRPLAAKPFFTYPHQVDGERCWRFDGSGSGTGRYRADHIGVLLKLRDQAYITYSFVTSVLRLSSLNGTLLTVARISF